MAIDSKATLVQTHVMAFFIVLSFVLVLAVLAPRYGADSRGLTPGRGRRQFPSLRDEEYQLA
jgi:hypothetical protein